jgi:MFS family permease
VFLPLIHVACPARSATLSESPPGPAAGELISDDPSAARPQTKDGQEPALRYTLLLAVLSFGSIVVTLVQTTVFPLLPELPRLTNSAPSNVSWVVTATLLAGAIATPVLGRAGDMYGKRRMFLLALAALTVGSVAGAATSNLSVLIAARAAQGVGAAAIPLAMSILRDVLPRERIGGAVAFISSTMGIGAALGLPLAAVLMEFADWHVMFWATAVLGAGAFVAAWRLIPVDRPGARARFDTVGALGLSAGLVCLLLAVSKGGDWGWTGGPTLGLTGAAVLIFAGWTAHQRRAARPLVDLRLAARRAVLLPHIAAMFAGFSVYANTLVTSQLVQAPKSTGYGLGLSVAWTGLCLLPSGLIMFAFAPVSARISASYGAKTTLICGSLAMAAGYVVRYIGIRSLWTILIGAAVVSIGTALVYSALPTLVMQAVPQAQTAAANGLNVLSRTIGQALCSASVAAVLAHHTITAANVTAPALDGYRTAFAIAGFTALVACGFTAALAKDTTGLKAKALTPALSGDTVKR